VPLGAYLAKRLEADLFKRLCASLNVWVITLGLSAVLQTLDLVQAPAAYLALAVVMSIDVYLLRRFFSAHYRAQKLTADAV
jgi:hypothetical protein